jgi:hypothetical protein
VLAALEDITRRLPFEIQGLDSDCGSEFINHAMLKYCDTNDITFTRGRSYHKNDNCYIEQKNSSVIRKSIFHYRYDTPQSLNPFYLKKSITKYQNKLIKEVSRQQQVSVSSDT